MLPVVGVAPASWAAIESQRGRLVTITLPYPPSANRYWRNVNGRMVKSAEARGYQESAGWMAKEQGLQPLVGAVAVDVRVYRPAQRGDLDNCLKVVLDAMKGIGYDDDSQIIRITAERFNDKQNPRIELAISSCSLGA